RRRRSVECVGRWPSRAWDRGRSPSESAGPGALHEIGRFAHSPLLSVTDKSIYKSDGDSRLSLEHREFNRSVWSRHAAPWLQKGWVPMLRRPTLAVPKRQDPCRPPTVDSTTYIKKTARILPFWSFGAE